MDELRSQLTQACSNSSTMSGSYTAVFAGVLWLMVLACGQPDAQSDHVAAVVAAGGTVDSALSTEERLRRFRATVADRPDTLRRASPTLDHLAQRWVAAVQGRDTIALNAMLIDRAEFAWLFYPTTRLALPPYDMPPALLWEQLLANSEDGVRNVLSRFGGRPLIVRSVRCPLPVNTEGTNLLRQGCLVRLRLAADTVPEDRYFGTIVEREGRFKFLGFSNKL